VPGGRHPRRPNSCCLSARRSACRPAHAQPHPRSVRARGVSTGAGGGNGIAQMWNRRGISVSSYEDQSHDLHPHPYIMRVCAARRSARRPSCSGCRRPSSRTARWCRWARAPPFNTAQSRWVDWVAVPGGLHPLRPNNNRIIIASADRWATCPARYAARSGRCWAAAAAARRGRGRPPSSACWRRRRGARRARRPPVRLACPPVPIGPPCLGVCIHCDPIAAVRRRRAMACLSMHRRRKNTGRGRALPVRPLCARWLSAAAAAGGDCLASPSSSPSKARGVTALQVRGA
jgi:hypothetical protein